MAIRDEVLDVLTSDATRRINFAFTSIRGQTVSVDSTTFQRVVDAIRADRIVVFEETVPGTGGTYYAYPDPEIDGMSGFLSARPTRNRRGERGNMVHEAVHASFDLMYTRNLPQLENQAAAFLAQFLFYRHAGLDQRGAFDVNRPAGNIYQVIWNATSTVVGGGTVPERHMTPLRNHLERHPYYRGRFREGCPEGSRECYFSHTYNG